MNKARTMKVAYNNRITRTILLILIYAILCIDRLILVLFPFINSYSLQSVEEFRETAPAISWNKVKNIILRLIAGVTAASLILSYHYNMIVFICITVVMFLGWITLGIFYFRAMSKYGTNE